MVPYAERTATQAENRRMATGRKLWGLWNSCNEGIELAVVALLARQNGVCAYYALKWVCALHLATHFRWKEQDFPTGLGQAGGFCHGFDAAGRCEGNCDQQLTCSCTHPARPVRAPTPSGFDCIPSVVSQ